ncbi:hypothetical protein OS493_031634 [Desmophyllum pertusum]|uniref:BRICHOS domain-containing protein n=1 Tax=Desmophyllum pertusum TaxID=174260 RepID=A0A9W9YBP0_9CNID|nr:hypothetical protein OS493_031634 [Desmophyllum pertusum]
MVESYSFSILEKGTMVKEVVDVDVDSQTEVFRVPQHNDVDAMDLMNDFNVGLSVRRIPSTQDCYVSKLDSSLPGPEKMRINMEQVWSQSLSGNVGNVTTKINEWKVIGLADRLALPQKFLDFCGSFPIYNIEKISVDLIRSALQRGHGRGKRSHVQQYAEPCTPHGVRELTRCSAKQRQAKAETGQQLHFKMKCTYKTRSCFYVYDCTALGQGDVDCTYKAHYIDFLGFCCYPIC